MKCVWRSDIGKVRKTNEDSVFTGKRFFMVADGMGGHLAGEVASAMASEMIGSKLDLLEPRVDKLLDAVDGANRAILRSARKHKEQRGMGTTVTALWVDDDHVLLAQIGDSRAYLLRSGLLRQCTHDHSLVAEMVRCGEITEEEARTHPRRNIITRALGTDDRVETDVFEIGRRKGDRWLLCSDGLTGYLRDEELSLMLEEGVSDEVADRMLRLAVDRGGSDNISLILLEDEEGGGDR